MIDGNALAKKLFELAAKERGDALAAARWRDPKEAATFSVATGVAVGYENAARIAEAMEALSGVASNTGREREDSNR